MLAWKDAIMIPHPAVSSTFISLSHLVAVTPLTEQFAVYNLLKDLWTAYLVHRRLRHLMTCQPLLSTFLSHHYLKYSLFANSLQQSDVELLLTSTQFNRERTFVIKFSRNILFLLDLTSSV